MTLDADSLAAKRPELDAAAVHRHVARLPEDYASRFDLDAAAQHLGAIAALTDAAPGCVIVEPQPDDKVACTVIAFDHPHEFSLIAGVLAGFGFDIVEGDVYTLAPPEPPEPPSSAGRSRLKLRRDPLEEAVIIDRFVGKRIASPFPDAFDAWSEHLRDELARVIALLDRNADDATLDAKRRVNERVTEQLATIQRKPETTLLPVELELEPVDDRLVRLTVRAQDTPAYLYALTTALSLRGVSIQRLRIHSDPQTHQLTDVIDLLPGARRHLHDKQWLEHVKLSALLTKQFTYFLESSPDPYMALTRFERLTEDFLSAASADSSAGLATLADPKTLRDLAKLLGTSQYLWEDFIRGQSTMLSEILLEHADDRRYAEPAETTPLRMEQALADAVGLSEQCDRLNRFKERELLLLDLDHLLNPAVDFRAFAERLTFLAENLIAAASRLVYDDLCRSYGPPAGVKPLPGAQTQPGQLALQSRNLPYAVFGLGKLGGCALGYASDIELLFVYADKPTAMTRGGKRKPVSLAEFFATLARETAGFIRTKRDGIFEVDLRLRPYGKEGPLASSQQQFETYYSGAGPAHPFERLALVRLRWIAGNPELGFNVEQARDKAVYEQPDKVADLDALWDIWTRGKREKLVGPEAARPNAKYSPGALVDLEGVIQLLQVLHARRAPQLRVPRITQAIEALHRAGVLSPQQFADIRGAYGFFRVLINGLRVLRGNAKDLFLPASDSLELLHLARRTGYERDARETQASPADRLMRDFNSHTRAVRQFIEQQFQRPAPGVPGAP